MNYTLNSCGGLWPSKHLTNPTLFIRGGRSNHIEDDDAPLIRQMSPQAEIATYPRPVTGSQSRLNPTIKQVLIDHRESNSGPAD